MSAGVILLAPGPVFIHSAQVNVFNNSTVTASGSAVSVGQGSRLLALVINILHAPTGTLPTLTFTLQEVDPIDNSTSVGTMVVGEIHTTAGTEIISIPLTLTGAVRVSWAISGIGASFTGVNAALIAKVSSTTSGVDTSLVEHTLLTDSQGRLIISGPGNATITSVPVSISDTLLLAPNVVRRGVLIFNANTTSTLYVSYGTGTASLTSYSTILGPTGYLEVPSKFTGEIRGIWDSAASGTAQMTEFLT